MRLSETNASVRRRLVVFPLALLTLGIAFIGFPSMAQAAGPCSAADLSNQGYFFVERIYPRLNGTGSAEYGAAIETWVKGSLKVARGANYIANGKTNLLMTAGTVYGGTNLGVTGGIGTAPSGGWCSTVTSNWQVSTQLHYTIGQNYYTTGEIAPFGQ
ncbi:hypothetical protein I6A60_18805 [Frankia sp. AgB1.9]|uniref:hypothetical protein n=1 Tax=unclassified Frankia TaxID=2632575 RepID=UPI0019317196|nr:MULTISPECIES: hypothetical protein [unclassified Frankia]MBL7492970.1 hypothetical protein [Frankia sp. AgW1.1]MBL7549911.1 hypothetical protein [Frankia sp. AgB1.9]